MFASPATVVMTHCFFFIFISMHLIKTAPFASEVVFCYFGIAIGKLLIPGVYFGGRSFGGGDDGKKFMVMAVNVFAFLVALS